MKYFTNHRKTWGIYTELILLIFSLFRLLEGKGEAPFSHQSPCSYDLCADLCLWFPWMLIKVWFSNMLRLFHSEIIDFKLILKAKGIPNGIILFATFFIFIFYMITCKKNQVFDFWFIIIHANQCIIYANQCIKYALQCIIYANQSTIYDNQRTSKSCKSMNNSSHNA